MGDVGAVAAELAENEGIITIERAVGCGLSRGQIRQRLESGAWKPITRGVYRSASHPYTESAMVRAAVAAHRGTADRTTAAWWHGLLTELPDHLTMAVRSKPTALRWTAGDVRVLRRRYHADDVTTVRGLAVTGLPMTVLTAAAALDDGSRLMDRALQAHPVTVADLEASLERNAGIAGFTRARGLVAVAGGDTESAAERLFVDLLIAERIGGWELQRKFGPWRLDVAWPEEKVAVEIDGWAFHQRPDQFERDHRKRNALAKAHWIPLGYTWHRLTDDPGGCMREVIDALAERRAELS